MSFLLLSLYEHPSGSVLEPERVIHDLKEWFPEANLLPGDQLAAEVQRAEQFFAKDLAANPHGSERKVVESLRRKSRTYGPAYAYEIPCDNGERIRGTARKYDVIFFFNEDLRQQMRDRLFGFLRSIGVGKISTSTNDERQSEVLLDMPGDVASAAGAS